jgi:hypothetical protein
MTEIKKLTKIVILYYGIAGVLFAFIYLVFTNFQLSTWPYDDPVSFWSLGNSLLVLGIASFFAYFKSEWEQIKLYFEIMLMWDFGSILMDIAIVVVITLPEVWVFQMILNFVLLIFNLVIGLYCYFKQRS